MISDHLLHLASIIALGTVGRSHNGTQRALAAVKMVARVLPPADLARATRVASRLRMGTCLTRAMTVAARLPGAEVVVGVSPPSARFRAHAWVEFDGVPLRASEPDGDVILRLA